MIERSEETTIRSFASQLFDFHTTQPFSLFSQRERLRFRRHESVAQSRLDDRSPGGAVGQPYEYSCIESSRPQHGRTNQTGFIRRPDRAARKPGCSGLGRASRRDGAASNERTVG